MAKKEKEEKVKKVQSLDDMVATWNNEEPGAVMHGDMTVFTNIEGLPTGSIALDMAIGIGGIPKGRFTEIYGPEASGKTTVCLEIVANAQRNGSKVAYIDVEHAINLAYARDGIGVDINDWYFTQPRSGEKAFDMAIAMVQTGELGLIVVDSVAGMVPQAELDGEMGDSQIGAQARMMGKGLRKLASVLYDTNTAAIFVNQLRDKIGVMFGSPETTPGGKALKYASSLRLDIRKIDTLDEKGVKYGHRAKVRIVKSRLANPLVEPEFNIIWGKGIDELGSLIDTAGDFGLVKQSGSSFKYGDKSFNGRAKLREFFEQNPNEVKAVEASLRGQLKNATNKDQTPSEDTIAIVDEE